MAQLSNLPNETIKAIWGLIDCHEDVVSFALVSKHINAVGQGDLQNSRDLLQRYAKIDTSNKEGFGGVALLLRDIGEHPRVKNYIRYANLEDFARTSWCRDTDDLDPEKSALITKVKGTFESLVRVSTFLKVSFTYLWRDAEAIMALLLTIMPNLSSLSFNSSRDKFPRLTEVLETLTTPNQNMTKSPLSRLVKVQMHAGESYDPHKHEWFCRIAALPSVRTIHLVNWGRFKGEHGNIDQQILSPRQSCLTTLRMICCQPTARQLTDMLQLIGGLQTFIFDTKDAHTYAKLNAINETETKSSWIRAGLLAFAKHSLQSLIILRPFLEDGPMGSLCSFQVLKHVECEAECFPGDTADELIMHECFPPSIETITLYNRDCRRLCRCDSIDSFTKEFRRSSEVNHLPKLRALTFKQAKCESYCCYQTCPHCASDSVLKNDFMNRPGFELLFARCRCSDESHEYWPYWP